ncbi:MAG TPA: alpha/beta fold hydrolase [Anaerolineales bacterium]|nr:alpha/beta fold hydrolase [Anaerolineales bacterium]
MKRSHWVLIAAGVLLVGLTLWQFNAAQAGLQISHWSSDGLPLTRISPAGLATDQRPLVLIGHGFAGSRAVMRSFALALAHAGYEVVLWDFTGHGANPRPLPEIRGGLEGDALAALQAAQAIGLGGSGQVAILGHSMGSGAALTFGQVRPETSATIAVSPVGVSVTPELPRNLLLMAGSLEAPFIRNAENLLAQAGGAGGNPSAGTARQLVVIPGVEHITILFSPSAHDAARQWLEAVFGLQPGAAAYTDRRLLWYGLGLAGTLLLLWGLAPLLSGMREAVSVENELRLPALWRRLIALLGGALGATILLWFFGRAGVQLRGLLGLQVGGYLLIWFGVAGLLACLLLGRWPDRPGKLILVQGLVVFAALWLGAGWLGQAVWLHWLLIPLRLIRWPVGAALMLPWLLAVGQAAAPASKLGRVGWWLAHSLIVLGALFLALRLSPELGFLTLILPVFPLMLGLHALASGSHRSSWAFASSGALFLSWALLAVFPLQ